ncbi:MAG: hypothetical protein WBP92_19025 [Candidatus Acidiferrales bacterium]
MIRLAYLENRESPGAVLIPGGKLGVWLAGSVATAVTLTAIVLSFVPQAGEAHKWLFETKLVGGTVGGVFFGLVLYWRGARAKAREAARAAI